MQTFVAFLAVALAVAYGQSCENDFRRFATCLRDERESASESRGDQQRARSAISRCFTDEGCSAPNFNADPFEGNDMLKAMTSMFDNMTPEQKQCMQEKMMGKMKEKLEDCMGQPLPQAFQDAMKEGRGQSSGQRNAKKQQMRMRMNIAKSVQNCVQNEGGNQNSLRSCISDLTDERREAQCEAQKDCTSGLSRTCINRADDLREKLCDCMSQVREEMKREREAQQAQRQQQQQQQQQSRGGLFGGFNRNRGGGGGGRGGGNNPMMKTMQECGVDTDAMRQQMMGGCRGIQCLTQMQAKQAEMKEAMKGMQQYMEEEGRDGPAICQCDL